jgi:hypothetical protein
LKKDLQNQFLTLLAFQGDLIAAADGSGYYTAITGGTIPVPIVALSAATAAFIGGYQNY